MRKTLLLLMALVFSIGTFRFFSQRNKGPVQTADETLAPVETQPKEIPSPQKKTPIKTTPKQSKAQLSKKAIPARDQSQVLETLESRHLANTDEDGVIYPTSLTVDGEHVVAYGDLIVGHSRFVEDYQNGEKQITLPPPQTWPQGIIPYRTQGITTEQERAIESIARVLEDEANIKLIPYTSGMKAWVTFKQGSEHCYAQVGYAEGERAVSLNEKCNYEAIFHEIFHVLGFYHEQNRFDRDEHLQIIWENIDEQHWPQFEKFSKRSYPKALQETEFTTQSFMLYPPTTFSNSQDYSIVQRDGTPYQSPVSPSPVDFERLRLLYRP